jgi:hypothetical protein
LSRTQLSIKALPLAPLKRLHNTSKSSIEDVLRARLFPFVELATVKPKASANQTVIDQHALAFRHGQRRR